MAPLFQIDLNADLGEAAEAWEQSADRHLLGLVSSASIACGFHAGDPVRMRRTIAVAARLGVTIGAHPSYPDPSGFGRREIHASPEEVSAYVAYQVGALVGCAAAEGARVRYVKPHGALYNRAARDPEVAHAIATAVRGVDASMALLGLAGSAMLEAARAAGLRAVAEAFLDRGYAGDGSLLPRDLPGAVLDNPAAAADRALRLAEEGVVSAADGSAIPVSAESYCVHGDGPHAAALLTAVRTKLASAGVTIRAFAR